MTRRKKRTLYALNGKRVRFSDLPQERQKELRSKWAKKGARTRARAVRKARKKFSDLTPQEQSAKRSEWAKKAAKTRKKKARTERGRVRATKKVRSEVKRELEKALPGKPTTKREAAAMQRAMVAARNAFRAMDLKSSFIIDDTRADGAVWGQLTVYDFAPIDDLYKFMIDAESIVVEPRGQWTWVTFLGDFEEEELEPGEEELRAAKGLRPYAKIRGMESIPINPYKPGIGTPYMFLASRDILRTLERKGKAPPKQVIFSMFWAPSSKRPEMRSALVRPVSRKKK